MSAIAITAARVVVYGAYGHTGRFVVAELLRRGLTPVLCGRDAQRLGGLQSEFPGLEARVATVDDAAALADAFDDADVVINCAGPFLDTAIPVGHAAVRAGAHYLDVAAEQQAVVQAIDALDTPAGARGTVVLPGMGFYGGLGDLLATAAMGDWPDADEIAVGTVLSYWHPTGGTRRTGERNAYPRVVVDAGELAPLATQPPGREWDFHGALGGQDMVCLPFSEIITIHRHLRSNRVTHWLNRRALEDVRDPTTPEPIGHDAQGRSSQQFTMQAEVKRGGERRIAQASGTDIYAVTAPLLGEAVKRLLAAPAPRGGAFAPGQLFDAGVFLQALSPAFLLLGQEHELPVHPAARLHAGIPVRVLG